MSTYTSGKWDSKDDVSIKSKIEFLQERFQHTDKSIESIFVRSLISEYIKVAQKIKNVKTEK